MECDSVHSDIEMVKKHAKINLPMDYINLIKSARKRPAQYSIKYLDFTFFKDFKSISDVGQYFITYLTTLKAGKFFNNLFIMFLKCTTTEMLPNKNKLGEMVPPSGN